MDAELKKMTGKFNEIVRVNSDELIEIKQRYTKNGFDLSMSNFNIEGLEINEVIEFVFVSNLCSFIVVISKLATKSPTVDFFSFYTETLSVIRLKVYEENKLEKSVWNGIGLDSKTNSLINTMNKLREELLIEFIKPTRVGRISDTAYTFYVLCQIIISTIDIFKVLMVNISFHGFESEFGQFILEIQKWMIDTEVDIDNMDLGGKLNEE